MDMIYNFIGVSISKITLMKSKSTFGSTFKTKALSNLLMTVMIMYWAPLFFIETIVILDIQPT